MHGHRLLAVLWAPARGARCVEQGFTPGAACCPSEVHASLPRQFVYRRCVELGACSMGAAALGTMQFNLVLGVQHNRAKHQCAHAWKIVAQRTLSGHSAGTH